MRYDTPRGKTIRCPICGKKWIPYPTKVEACSTLCRLKLHRLKKYKNGDCAK